MVVVHREVGGGGGGRGVCSSKEGEVGVMVVVHREVGWGGGGRGERSVWQ